MLLDGLQPKSAMSALGLSESPNVTRMCEWHTPANRAVLSACIMEPLRKEGRVPQSIPGYSSILVENHCPTAL